MYVVVVSCASDGSHSLEMVSGHYGTFSFVADAFGGVVEGSGGVEVGGYESFSAYTPIPKPMSKRKSSCDIDGSVLLDLGVFSC